MSQKNRFRIAILGHKRVPSREGGVEIVVEELGTRMAALGHTVTCYNRGGRPISPDADAASFKRYKGMRLATVWTVNKRGVAAMTASVSAAVCAAFGRYDVVHFHAEGPCAMLWLPKLLGKRCIATIHGLDHQRAKWSKFAAWYIRLGERCAVRFADEIIVLSENLQRYFMETYGRKTVLLPNGVTPAQPAPADLIRTQYGLDKDGYILFLGRLVPEKGLQYLVEAFQAVKTDKKLVIAGGAADTPEFQQELHTLAANDKRILFTDFVQGQVWAELYSNAYVYVLPSDLEGMPLSLLEAMAFGNCCLTSDIPECAQVIGENGVLFRQGDVSDLAEKLQQLCDSSVTVATYKQRAATVCDNYNWDEITRETLKLYEKAKR